MNVVRAGSLLGLMVLLASCASEPPPQPSPSPSVSAVATVTGQGFPDGPPALSEPMQDDVEEAARTEGIPAEVLAERMATGEQFSILAQGFARRFPEQYAASGLVRDGVEGAWIAFKGTPPPEVEAELAALPNDTELITDAPASAVELQAAAKLAVDEVRTQAKATSVQAVLDERTLGLTVTYTDGPNTDIQAASLSATEAARRAAPGLPEVPVTRSDDNPLRLQVRVKGGRGLFKNNTAVCTAAFTARRNGARGLLSAKHCPRSVRYLNRRGVIRAGAGARPTGSGGIDIRFYRTRSPNRTVARFRATGRDRWVRSVGNPTVGQTVCKWGHYSRYGCSVVTATNMCASFTDGKTRCGLAQTNTSITTNGDSGGPWFIGRTARGITTGADANSSVFTQISRVRTNLNARVMRK